MGQEADDTEVSTEECDMVKLNIFNLPTIQSIIIAKLKTKTSQKN